VRVALIFLVLRIFSLLVFCRVVFRSACISILTRFVPEVRRVQSCEDIDIIIDEAVTGTAVQNSADVVLSNERFHVVVEAKQNSSRRTIRMNRRQASKIETLISEMHKKQQKTALLVLVSAVVVALFAGMRKSSTTAKTTPLALACSALVLLCYKRFGPQKGQHGSCRINARASLMRSVAIE